VRGKNKGWRRNESSKESKGPVANFQTG
jgi:hypothetical protein